MGKEDQEGVGGCVLAGILGIVLLVPTIRMGPIDAIRTIYNQNFGDAPVLRRELLDYARRDIYRKNPKLNYINIEKTLADELNTDLENGKIAPEAVSFEELWDISEEHARSGYQRWVWSSLKE